VVTETLINRFLDEGALAFVLDMPVLPLLDGYWMRAGRMRAELLSRGRKAKLADTLIAQCCLDHEASLITHNGDFDHFLPAGLKLL